MTQYYLDKTSGSASNSNAGTNPALPLLTWAYAWSICNPGDRVDYQGNYSENLGGGTTLPSGTAGNPITFRPYAGTSPVFTTGSGNPAVPIIDPAHGEQYINFEDSIFDGNVSGSKFTNFAIGGNNTPQHWTLTRVEVKNTAKSGVLPHGNYWSFINCNVHDCGINVGGTPQDHGLYLSGTDNLVDGGTYWNNWGLGVQVFDSGSIVISRNTIRNAFFYNNGGGFILSSGVDNTGYNNVIYGNVSTGASIAESGFSDRGSLYNNTVYNNGGYGILNGLNTFNTIIRNNISYLNGATDIYDAPGTATVDHNITVNPSFKNAGAAQFGIQPGSVAIGAGYDLSAIFTTDLNGTHRLVPYDCGAYVYARSLRRYGGLLGIGASGPYFVDPVGA